MKGSARRIATAILTFSITSSLAVAAYAQQGNRPRFRVYKLDEQVERLKASNPNSFSSVIVTLAPGATLPAEFARFARPGRLGLINGRVLDLPNQLISQLEANPEISQVHFNRPIGKFNYRTSVTVGALEVQQALGYTGAGIGVAVIDSGVTAWHDDLTRGGVTTKYPYGDQRIAKFVDFVDGRSQPYDDSGHGTHVTGIIAGNGYDSKGEKAGIAPNASIVSLKVLNRDGEGNISHLLAALDWIAANHRAYNIRIVNVSVGAPIFESYWTDPLTLAVKKLVEDGIIVVGAAGNFGRNEDDEIQFGGITAPSNAPWVITVGASSTQGTLTRSDDIVAAYSSNGPTFIDFTAKPDLVAPGTGTVSLAAQGSEFIESKADYLIDGNPVLGYKPYLAMTGTSMAAPVVSGTLALMLEANPSLTPNFAKAILQYTAEPYDGYEPLQQGTGFLNTLGAVELAAFYARNQVGEELPIPDIWSGEIIWGNYIVSGGYLSPFGSAWDPHVIWGSTSGPDGEESVTWGTGCGVRCGNIVWGTNDANGVNVVWESGARGNIVWGTGGRGNIVWGTAGRGNIVWGTGGRGNIVWGTGGRGNIVWGTGGRGNIVWGTGSRGNIVWGTGGRGNIVWGTDCGGQDCDGVVWGEANDEGYVWGSGQRGGNIVWGTGGRGNVVWGTAGRGNIVWGTGGRGNIVWGTGGRGNIVWGTNVEHDVTWGSNPDAVLFPENSDEPLPNVAIEFRKAGGQ